MGKPRKSNGWRWDKRQMKDKLAAQAPKERCTCGPSDGCNLPDHYRRYPQDKPR